MSERCRSDDGSFIGAGKSLSSAYNGFGILFENLTAAGENGGSPLLNDGGANGDEVRWELLTTSGLTLADFNEDGSFSSDGIGSFTYRSFVNNAAVGDFTVTITAAGVAYSITCETVTDSHAANDVSLYRGYIMAIDAVTDVNLASDVNLRRGYTLTCDTIADYHQSGEVTLTYTTPSGTAYSITCEAVTDTHQAGAIAFSRGYVMQASGVSDDHLALTVTLRYSGQEIALISSYSVNYKNSDVSGAYKQKFVEGRYGNW